jgi:multiple sugar transport system substrate-binding protein
MPAPGAQRLRVLGRAFDPFARALRRQVAAFAPPTRLDDAWLELGELQRRVLVDGALRDGEADLAIVPTDWLAELIDDGHVAPLAEGLPDDWEDAWTPSLRGLQTAADGEVHGVAYHDGPTMLLYRRDLVEEPPRDWDGVVETARSSTDRAADRWGMVLAGASDGHNDVYDFVAQLAARGGRLVEEAGEPLGRGATGGDRATRAHAGGTDAPRTLVPAFGGAAGADALRFLHDLWHVHSVVSPAARRWDSVESGRRFAAGEAALTVNWAGFASLSAPADSPTHGLVACAPPPGRALNVYWVAVVGAGARDLPLARAVARHLATPAMDRITAQEGATATRRDSWADPAVQALAPYYAALEDAHRDAVTMPRTRNLPALSAVLSRLVAAAVDGPRDAIPSALDAAVSHAAEVLAAPTVHQGAPSR